MDDPEILQVVFDLADGQFKPRFINGKELADWQSGPGMIEFLRQKMKEGCCLRKSNALKTIILECPRQKS